MRNTSRANLEASSLEFVLITVSLAGALPLGTGITHLSVDFTIVSPRRSF
jgi:hypothetical protein